MFSCYKCTSEIKLNIKWQMIFQAKKINMDKIDGIVTLVVLYWVDNFKTCNKHLCLLVKYFCFVTKKVPIVDFKSQLDYIWQYHSVDSFKQLIVEN